MKGIIIVSVFLAALALSGCESPSRWTSGNYEIYLMGGTDELEFGVDVGGGMQGLVNPKVLGVGEDNLWIVLKRQPFEHPTITEYFYLPKRNDEEQKKGRDAVHGPFSEAEFGQKIKELNLPPFSMHF